MACTVLLALAGEDFYGAFEAQDLAKAKADELGVQDRLSIVSQMKRRLKYIHIEKATTYVLICHTTSFV